MCSSTDLATIVTIVTMTPVKPGGCLEIGCLGSYPT